MTDEFKKPVFFSANLHDDLSHAFEDLEKVHSMLEQIVRNMEETADLPENEAVRVYLRDTADLVLGQADALEKWTTTYENAVCEQLENNHLVYERDTYQTLTRILQWDMVDMKKRTIRICRTLVQQTDNSYVLKDIAKNKSSHRIIPISDQLYAALEREPDKTGAVVRHSPNNLYDAVNSICKRLDFPLVGVHGLRHSFASLGYKLGIPAKIMRQIGGWESDDIMMKIYTHISTRDVNDAAAEILKFFNNG